MIPEVHARFERLDIVVNNAGSAIRKPFDEISESDFDYQFDLARGAFFAMQEAARRMREGGRIINITSAAVKTCPADSAIYAGAKSAMEAFARSLSRQVGPRGITVNVVAPGVTMTELLQNAPDHILQSVKRNGAKTTGPAPDTSSVYPSGCDRATFSAPTIPPAADWFSITSGCGVRSAARRGVVPAARARRCRWRHPLPNWRRAGSQVRDSPRPAPKRRGCS